MAAISSTGGGGAWNTTAAWTPAQIPVSGDTVTIASGSPVTVPDGYTAVCGTSPASGGAVALVINDSLTVGGGTSGQLTVRGPVTHGNATVWFKAGSVLEFDASQATTPLSQTYAWTCTGFSRGNKLFKSTGAANGGDTTGLPPATTGGSHVTVRSNAGGGNGYLSGGAGFNDSFWLNNVYTDFLRIGDATNKGATPNPQSDTTLMVLDYCTFDSCGAIPFILNSAPGGGGWSITRCVWRNSVGYPGPNGRQSCLKLVNVNKSTGTFLVDRCVFDIPPVLPYNGNTYTNNYFKSGFDTTTGTAPWALFDGNFVHYDAAQCGRAGAPVLKYGGDCTNCYHLIDGRVQTALYTGSAGGITAATNGSNYGTMTVSGTPFTAHAFESTTVSGTLKICHVVITAGTGLGQVRGVCFNSTNQIQVTMPWDTIPDSTSAFAVYPEWANPHMLGPETTAGIGITGGNIQGNVFDHTGADSNGDCVVNANQPSGVYTLKFNIGLPNAARDNAGTFITLSSGTTNTTTQSFLFEHNTWFTGAQNAGALNEGGTPNNAAGQVTSYRGNVAWCEPSKTSIYSLTANNVASFGSSPATSPYGPYVLDDTDHATSLPGTSTANIVTNCDYNGSYGQRAGYATKGYNVNQTTPGTHDVSGDPQFVDRWRNLAKWAVSRGSSGTHVVTQVADAVGYIQTNPGLLSSSLMPYIRGGFRPQNSAFSAATYSGDPAALDAAGNTLGGTLGAMAFLSASVTPGTLSTSSVGSASLTVSTTAASGGTSPYNYQFQRGPSGTGPWTNVGSNSTATTFNDSGLTPSTTYFYQCVVTDAVAATATSAAVSVATTAAVTDPTPTAGSPAVAATVTVTGSAASGGLGPYTYQWYRSTSSGFTPGVGNILTGQTSLTLNDTGLSAGTTYYYKLRATDSLGATGDSAQVAVAVPGGSAGITNLISGGLIR